MGILFQNVNSFAFLFIIVNIASYFGYPAHIIILTLLLISLFCLVIYTSDEECCIITFSLTIKKA